jgi:OFA family oxalate/formate antiporter-like MFS transporter
MGISALLFGYLQLSASIYLILSAITGFSFGANFVLFAKETIQVYGLSRYNRIYPFVFLGYGIAGVFGPTFGGWFYDLSGNYLSSLVFSFILCLVIAILYIVFQVIRISGKQRLHDKKGRLLLST